MKLVYTFLLCNSVILLCGQSYADPRVERFKWEDVNLEISIDPPTVDLAEDTEVVFSLEYPGAITASLPTDLADRFDGFNIAGAYSQEKITAGSISRQSIHLRLTPVPTAERFRIKPIPVQIVDPSSHPPKSSWYPTRPVTIERAATGNASETVSTDLSPRHIRPSYKIAPKLLLYILIAAAVITVLYFAAASIRTRQKIKKMSPKERAFFELSALLKKKLPEKGLFKDFYIELTMVVRRYIERRYGIRAPEQTTEEFLSAAANHPGFNDETM